MAHLESRRKGKMKPILSGTSLAGVMRGQALRIARTVSNDEELANRFVRNLFGYMPADRTDHDKVKRASKVTVSETPIVGGTKLVQSRVAIDRFTGGALESALFEEQPVFGGQVTLKFSIKDPSEAEVGLLLLVLKDLWTGFIPIGGEASVGRGRLCGRHALICHNGQKWQLQADGNGGVVGAETAVQLEEYVTHFVNEMKRTGAG
jgi:CRISPR/Cas system CSM-associated protein Csm3 (group 7 of RAMP superfamily)